MPHWTHGAMLGRKRGAAVSYDVWLRDLASATYYSGAAPYEIFDPGAVSSGTITGKVASLVLTPVTSPLYQQPISNGVGDPLGVGFDVGTTDSFDAAAGTVLDFAADPFAILALIQRDSDTTGTSYRIMGKAANTSEGWILRPTATVGQIAMSCYGSSGSQEVTATSALGLNVPGYVFIYRSIASGLIGIASSFSAHSTADGTGIGSLSYTARLFSLGSVAGRTAGPYSIGPTLVWTGANAETTIAASPTWLPTWASVTGAF